MFAMCARKHFAPTALVLAFCSVSTLAAASRCPCALPELCKPIEVRHEREVFGFSTTAAGQYQQYDWDQVTTVAWNKDPELMCLAHSKGARVVLDGRGGVGPAMLSNATARATWIAAHLQEAINNHMDGTNFDFEDPIGYGDQLARDYTTLVKETAHAFHAAITGSQISVDIPWSPHGIDGRNFDWVGLAEAADVLFLMAYDMQSQIWGRCVASANSPVELVEQGVRHFLELGIPADKLILGVPWYGYRYQCINAGGAGGGSGKLQAAHSGGSNPGEQQGSSAREASRHGLAPVTGDVGAAVVPKEQSRGVLDLEVCEIQPVAFRGCSCSDAAGRQFDYATMLRFLSCQATGSSHAVDNTTKMGEDPCEFEGEGELKCTARKWDTTQHSPYFVCRAGGDGPVYQFWYDDPDSLVPKYLLADRLGLRGVGMWFIDALPYWDSSPAARGRVQGMWGAMRAFKPALVGARE